MPLRNQSHLTTFAIGFAAGAAVGANWPHLKKHVGPLAAIASDKFSDLYTMITRLIAEQKEIFDDELEERKSEGRRHAASAAKNGAGKASVSQEVDEEQETETEEDFAASLAAAFAKTVAPEPRVKAASARKLAPKRKASVAANGKAHSNGASRSPAPAVKVAARRKKGSV